MSIVLPTTNPKCYTSHDPDKPGCATCAIAADCIGTTKVFSYNPQEEKMNLRYKIAHAVTQNAPPETWETAVADEILTHLDPHIVYYSGKNGKIGSWCRVNKQGMQRIDLGLKRLVSDVALLLGLSLYGRTVANVTPDMTPDERWQAKCEARVWQDRAWHIRTDTFSRDVIRHLIGLMRHRPNALPAEWALSEEKTRRLLEKYPYLAPRVARFTPQWCSTPL